MIFTGHVNGCQQFWYTDDGETYHFAKNATGAPLCTIGIGEVVRNHAAAKRSLAIFIGMRCVFANAFV